MDLIVNILTYAAVALFLVSLSATLSHSRKNGRSLSLTTLCLNPFSGLKASDPEIAKADN